MKRIDQFSVEQFEAILNAIPGFISWVDKDLNYLGVNQLILDFFNLKTEDFLGNQLGTVTPGDHEHIISYVKYLFESEETQLQREIYFDKGEETHWILFTAQKYNNNQNMLLVSIDITDLKRAQEKIQNDEVRAMQTGRLIALGEMVATITHEINNPLTIVSMQNELLKAQLAQPELDKTKLLAIQSNIDAALDKVQKIIESVKNLVRDGAGQKKVKYSVANIIDDALFFAKAKFAAQGVELSVDEFDETLVINCVPIQINQTLLILLNNAYDAIERSETKWVRIMLSSTSDKLCISIIDSGQGIADELSSKIFDPFYSTKEVGKGSGIGLGLAKKIITSHGGNLTIDKNSTNTKFDLLIPKE